MLKLCKIQIRNNYPDEIIIKSITSKYKKQVNIEFEDSTIIKPNQIYEFTPTIRKDAVFNKISIKYFVDVIENVYVKDSIVNISTPLLIDFMYPEDDKSKNLSLYNQRA